MKNLYPNLNALFSGHFHQDWEEQSLPPDEILRRYLADASLHALSLALAELTVLLSHSREERSLRSALLSLGCFYNPRADGMTFDGWLRRLQMKLQTHCAGIR